MTLLRLAPLVGVAAVLPASAQSLLVTHYSQNGGRHVAAVSPVDGNVQTASFIDLDADSGPANGPLQCLRVAGEWWTTDPVMESVHRWDTSGTDYLSEALEGLGDVLGGIEAFGATWFCVGDPGVGARLLVRVDGLGVTTYPLTKRPYGLTRFGNELVYSHSQGVVRVDPTTGAELGDLLLLPGQGGYGQPTIRRSTGNLLIARQAGHQDVVEVDASGTIVNEYDTLAVLGIGLVFSAQELLNGDLLLSTETGLFVVDPAMTRSDQVMSGIRCRFVTEAPSVHVGTAFCGPGVTNSTGHPATLGGSGSSDASDNTFRLAANGLPAFSTALFMVGPNQGFVPAAGGSLGNLCLSTPIGRYNSQVDAASTVGFVDQRMDLTALPQGNGLVAVTAGQTWNWQVWYRDTVGGVPTSNFTNGLSVAFQ